MPPLAAGWQAASLLKLIECYNALALEPVHTMY